MNLDFMSLDASFIGMATLVSALTAFIFFILYAGMRRMAGGSSTRPERERKRFSILAKVACSVAFISAGLFFLMIIQPVDDLNKRVLDLKAQILVLRGDVEAKNPSLEAKIRQQALKLAVSMGEVDENQLKPANQIIKHEYGGWAYLMRVSTFDFGRTPTSIPEEERIRYAKKAIAEFDLALEIMARITDAANAKDAYAISIYEWMTGSSQDVNRTFFLKAIALAVIAQAGGGTREAALAELKNIQPPYLKANPPGHNPDLAWAMQVIKQDSQ